LLVNDITGILRYSLIKPDKKKPETYTKPLEIKMQTKNLQI